MAAAAAAAGRPIALPATKVVAATSGMPKNGIKRSTPAASAGNIGSGMRASRNVTARTSTASTLCVSSLRMCVPTDRSTTRQMSRARGRLRAGTSDSHRRSSASWLALQ